MSRYVVGHALLLVAAAALAWFATSKKDEKVEEGEVVLVDVKPEQLTSVAYTWPKGSSTVKVGGPKDARTYTVHVERSIEKPKPKKPKGDAGVVDAGVDEEPEEREVADFAGGRTVEKSLESLAPIKARRGLGVVDEGRLKTMGLVDVQRKIVVEAGGQKTTLEIGETTYGGQGRYARVQGKPEVVLLESAVVSGLEGGAQQLMERRIVPQALEDITAVVVKVGDRTEKYLHVDKDQTAKRHFAKPDDPATDVKEATSLVSTLRGLRATGYTPDVADASEVGAFALEVAKGAPVEAVVLQAGDKYFVKTKAWTIEISAAQGKELVEDMDAAVP